MIGREALAKIGYIPIINLARQAGWVTTKERRSRRGGGFVFISTNIAQAANTVEFVEVYSKYAVAAGVTSQFDSPLPGPFDAVAVGILVLGLIDAGLLEGTLINAFADVSTTPPGSTTSSPPAPATKTDKDPQPEGDPKTTGTVPPPPPPPPPKPKEEKETCEEQRPDRIRCDDPKISGYDFRSENAAFSSIKVKGIRKEQSKEEATLGPCAQRGGFHTKVRRGNDYIASIVGCFCCDDSSGKAINKERAAVLYKP